MISKETFLKTIESLQREREFQDKLNDLFKEYCEDSNFLRFAIENTVLELLEEIFQDEGELISFCFYELDFLNNYKEGCYTYKDGSSIDISTWKKVYDRLISNMNENVK